MRRQPELASDRLACYTVKICNVSNYGKRIRENKIVENKIVKNKLCKHKNVLLSIIWKQGNEITMLSKVKRKPWSVVMTVLKLVLKFTICDDPDGIWNRVCARERFQDPTGQQNFGHFGTTIGLQSFPKRSKTEEAIDSKANGDFDELVNRSLSFCFYFQFQTELFVSRL